MSDENVKIVRSMYDNFGAGDLDAVLALISPDVLWDEGDGHPYGPPVRGHDDARDKVFARLGAEWEGMVTNPEHFLDCREFVVVLGRDQATYTATGKSVSAGVSHVFTVHDGKITSFTQYTDTHGWHLAMES